MSVLNKILKGVVDGYAEKGAVIVERYTKPLDAYRPPWQEYINMSKMQSESR